MSRAFGYWRPQYSCIPPSLQVQYPVAAKLIRCAMPTLLMLRLTLRCSVIVGNITHALVSFGCHWCSLLPQNVGLHHLSAVGKHSSIMILSNFLEEYPRFHSKIHNLLHPSGDRRSILVLAGIFFFNSHEDKKRTATLSKDTWGSPLEWRQGYRRWTHHGELLLRRRRASDRGCLIAYGYKEELEYRNS